MIDAYALSLAALLLTAGSTADLLGRRLMFAIGTAVFSAGSLSVWRGAEPGVPDDARIR